MTWENYGRWHVDHIIPCNYFDLTNNEDQLKCFHYSNLRPLWGIENLIKGNHLPINIDKYFWTVDGWIVSD